jgi:hypothetical protein
MQFSFQESRRTEKRKQNAESRKAGMLIQDKRLKIKGI